MVINHLDKLFVTSDASTIINEMEVQHPAAKLVVFASQAQEQEIGDGTNFVSPPFLTSSPLSFVGVFVTFISILYFQSGRVAARDIASTVLFCEIDAY